MVQFKDAPSWRKPGAVYQLFSVIPQLGHAKTRISQGKIASCLKPVRGQSVAGARMQAGIKAALGLKQTF
jgi:hypothetical protein